MKKLIKIEGACAVLALHHVSGLNEDTVLRICKLHDFHPAIGMEDEDWQEAAKDLGLSIRSCFVGSQRLSSFITKKRDGLYLIGTFDHLFVLDHGVIVDPREKMRGHYPGLGRLVKQAWKVTKPQ